MVEDDEKDQELSENEKDSSDKQKGEGVGSASFSQPELTPELLAILKNYGVTMQNVSDIIKSWQGKSQREILMALRDFSSGVAKASAHSEVDFKGADLSVLHNYFQYIRQLQHEAYLRATLAGNKHKPEGLK